MFTLAVIGAALVCPDPRALGSDPNTLKRNLAELKLLDDQGRPDQAIPQYRKLLREYPESAQVRLGLANDLAREDRCEDVPEPTSPRSAAGAVVSGICDFRRNNLTNAIARLSEALRSAPADREARIFLGRAYAEAGRPEEGIRVLKSAPKDGAGDAETLYWLGRFYDQMAQGTYDAMSKSYPDSALLLETQGDQLALQQRYGEALKAFEKARAVSPDAPGLHFELGNCYWHLERLDEAAAELGAELSVDPNHAQANFEQGDISVKRGDTDRGVALLARALALDPGLTEAHRSLGRAYLSRQEFAKALDEFSLVARADPSDHTIHALLASVYQRMGRVREAKEETRKYDELMKQQSSDLERREAGQNREAAKDGKGPPQ